MELAGRLHPLLVHFPIGLILAAAGAELIAIVTNRQTLHVVALVNVRLGAVASLAAAVAGWQFAHVMGVDGTTTLEWHRWIATIATSVTNLAALASLDARARRLYQVLLFVAALGIGIAGHLGGLLVWGANFFQN